MWNAKKCWKVLHRNINFKSWHGGYAGSYSSACRLPTTVLISDMIKIMKGNLARQMFLLHPELKKELWGGHLWNRLIVL